MEQLSGKSEDLPPLKSTSHASLRLMTGINHLSLIKTYQ
jgi:hypothetical protein